MSTKGFSFFINNNNNNIVIIIVIIVRIFTTIFTTTITTFIITSHRAVAHCPHLSMSDSGYHTVVKIRFRYMVTLTRLGSVSGSGDVIIMWLSS